MHQLTQENLQFIICLLVRNISQFCQLHQLKLYIWSTSVHVNQNGITKSKVNHSYMETNSHWFCFICWSISHCGMFPMRLQCEAQISDPTLPTLKKKEAVEMTCSPSTSKHPLETKKLKSWTEKMKEHSTANISGVSKQNGISPLYIIVEIYHSGRKPSIYY